MDITGLVVIVSQPFMSLFLIALAVSLIIILSYKFFVNLEKLNEAKKKMKQLQKTLIDAQKSNDVERMKKIVEEITEVNKVFMKESIKPMIISLILLVTIFPIISKMYTGKIVARLPFSLPWIGSELSWIGWYIIVSVTITWILRRLLGVDV
ncbi:MAG: DUF106 domain-containing protein [Candidatus Aenigmarchaeota archaeon]|nr:DUF106 domain-containing protein [Candidatus Aenigmarchaeota archaeon]